MANVMITRLTAFDRLVHLGTAASFEIGRAHV